MGIVTLNLYLIHYTISCIRMSPKRMFLFIHSILPIMFFLKKKKKNFFTSLVKKVMTFDCKEKKLEPLHGFFFFAETTTWF